MKTKKIPIYQQVEVVPRLNKAVNYFDSKSIEHFRLTFEKRITHGFFPFRYLKEIGYVDTIIDIRSTAVKKLLGIKSENNINGPLSTGLNGDLKSPTESKRWVDRIEKSMEI